jgi:hypothetical protein
VDGDTAASKTAAMDRRTTAPENRSCANPSAGDGGTAASKTTAMKGRATASTAAETSASAATMMAAADLDRHTVGRVFRRWRGAGTGERQRFGTLL